MMDAALSRRLAKVKLTKVMLAKDYTYWNGLVAEAEQSGTWDRLSQNYKDDILEAEREL